MKESKYNIYFKRKNRWYIYNALSCAIIACEESLINALKTGEWCSLTESSICLLKKNGCIVPDELNETAVFKKYYNSIQYCSNPEELRLVILPTYQCNLRCTYCFEEDCKDLAVILTEDKIAQIVSFVKSELSAPGRDYKRIAITLFGGEPFLFPDICIAIMEKMCLICKEYNMELKASAITNATLINENLVERLIKPYQIRLQITLDGEKISHDKKRVYANGTGSYDRVVCAIDLLNVKGCAHLIDLRLNVDRDNIESIGNVFEKFALRTNYMYVGLLRAAGHNGCNSDQCIDDNDYLINIRPAILPILNKYKAAKKYVPFGKQRPCALTRNGCFIIDSLLDVYKCDNLVGQSKYAVGRIVNGRLRYNSQFYSQTTWTPFDNIKCLKCKLLPACGKSCAYKCLLANNDINEPTCSMTEGQLIERIKAYLDEQEMKS